jgi:O-antigen/teichoic acid export membrane protein
MAVDAALGARPRPLWRTVASRSAPRWIAKGVWAIADQALFALSNFGINIVLARWLAPQDYGAFALAYSVFLIFSTVHSALLADPMTVFGAGRYRDTLAAYLAVLLRGHWVLTCGASSLLGTAGLVLFMSGDHATAIALLALAAANPFLLLLWLMRRSCYIRVQPHLAASGGAVYMAVVLGGAYALFRAHRLSSPAALLLMAAASVAAAVWLKWRLRFSDDRAADSDFRRSVVAQHWAYGRWAVGTGVLSALILQLYYLALPGAHGLASTATLKAMTNLIMPALQSFWVLSVLAVPKLVAVRGTGGFGRLVRRLLLVYGAAALVYCIALGWAQQPLTAVLYGGRYDLPRLDVWLMALLPIAAGLISACEAALRSLERSDAIFRAYAVAAFVTAAIGLPLVLAFSVPGAITGLLLAHGSLLAMMAWPVRRAAASAQESGSA